MTEVLVGAPIPESVEFGPEAIHLRWPRRCAEARYAGSPVRWSDIRDADPWSAPPELRLRDGRTIFVSAVVRDELSAALQAAGVTLVRRPPVWAHLLEPFLDTDYEIVRERFEAELAVWDFGPEEVRRLRKQVRRRMWALTLATWEWAHYGQADLLSVRYSLRLTPRWTTWRGYRRYRRWTDEIADRPTRGGTR